MATDIELLTTLRDAARRRDWNACRDATEAMLSRLPVPKMLRLAHQEVQRRLPLFERHHPHMRWPRVWLEALATDSPGTLDETTPEVLEEAPGPGGNNVTVHGSDFLICEKRSDHRGFCIYARARLLGGGRSVAAAKMFNEIGRLQRSRSLGRERLRNNFTEAVRQLALAAAASNSAQCVTHAIAAIAGVIKAEMMETGGTEHRELWDLWFQDALTLGEHSYSWVLGTIHRDPKVAAVELAAWNRLADELAAALGVGG